MCALLSCEYKKVWSANTTQLTDVDVNDDDDDDDDDNVILLTNLIPLAENQQQHLRLTDWPNRATGNRTPVHRSNIAAQ